MSSSNKKEWNEKILNPAIDRTPERKEEFTTESEIHQDAVYTPEDLSEQDYNSELSYPGEYPYTRGVQPNMYRGRVWTMRQYSGYANAEESNKRFKFLLDQGQTGLSVAFDLPTQTGLDSDHQLAQGEVGKVGVPISTLKDMEILLEGIPLDKVSTSMTINSTAAILLCLYIAVAKKQGVPVDQLQGTLQNDILKEYIARGTYIYPPRPSMRLVVDVFDYCTNNIPKWNTISVSGYHMREAGATAAQELAFTLSDGIEYVKAAVDAGLNVDDFGRRISFFFASHNNLLEEVAKFRAARRMWAKIMRNRFGATNSRAWTLRFHTQTAGVTLTAQQPDNNVVRCAIQALAAIMGGTQSLHVNSKDEALALPSQEAVQLSLRTQQVLANESGVSEVVDPLGGSYYVEHLTNKLESEANILMDKIDNTGGALAALEKDGLQIREIHESAYKHQMLVEDDERIVVGVNKYSSSELPVPGLLRIDPKQAKKQISRLNEVRKERDNSNVQDLLARLENVAKGTDNMIPAILECVEGYCTIGEISDVLRKVFGEQKEMISF